jgi:hypothetical protein
MKLIGAKSQFYWRLNTPDPERQERKRLSTLKKGNKSLQKNILRKQDRRLKSGIPDISKDRRGTGKFLS